MALTNVVISDLTETSFDVSFDDVAGVQHYNFYDGGVLKFVFAPDDTDHRDGRTTMHVDDVSTVPPYNFIVSTVIGGVDINATPLTLTPASSTIIALSTSFLAAVAGGSNIVQKGIAGKFFRIYAWRVSASANTTITFVRNDHTSELSGACRTYVAANSSVSDQAVPGGYCFETVTGEDLHLYSSAGVNIGVAIQYEIVA